VCVAATQANIYCMLFKPSWAFLMILTVTVPKLLFTTCLWSVARGVSLILAFYPNQSVIPSWLLVLLFRKRKENSGLIYTQHVRASKCPPCTRKVCGNVTVIIWDELGSHQRDVEWTWYQVQRGGIWIVS